MMWPPSVPAAGPMSIRWSAARIASSSCSTTSTVLPSAFSRRSVPSSRSLSRWCRPMLGSSSTYSTPVSPAADLAGEPDALRFAAGQRRRAAGQRQVFQPHIVQELQPLHDLLQDAPGDRGALRRQRRFHPGEPGQRAADRQVPRGRDVFAAHPHRQRLRLQARAVAHGAGFLRLVAAHLLAHPGAVGLLPAALQIVQHALERLGHAVGAHAVLVGELDRLLSAVQDQVRARLPAARPTACGW